MAFRSESVPGPWFKNAVIYAIDVDRFRDGDGDGHGDLQGIIASLPYLADLGVDTLWLTPFFRSPNRDNGYDVSDYYSLNPGLGTLETLGRLVDAARSAGMRILAELVVNHTSVDHPWFQAARRDPGSRFHDYYIWRRRPPSGDGGAGIFPGGEDSVWEYLPDLDAYYYHLFYRHQPDLNARNPEVMDEILKIIDFWLSFGVSGFRVDAAPHLIAEKGRPGPEQRDFSILNRLHDAVRNRNPDAILIGETDVSPDHLRDYFDDGTRLQMLFNFYLDNYIFLALAREECAPIAHALGQLPSLPPAAQWANFLRNLDELDLERLTDEERREVYRRFAPDESMRLYGRGIRRRLAPMLGGDRRRIEMAFSLLFSLPGAPVILYGDEIGMGDDQAIEGRGAVRLAMQWDAGPSLGFTTAGTPQVPHLRNGPFGADRVNVAAQQADPGSLWHAVRRIIHARRAHPVLGQSGARIIDSGNPAVLAHRVGEHGSLLAVHNLSGSPQDIVLANDIPEEPLQIISGGLPGGLRPGRSRVGPYGYGWFTLDPARRPATAGQSAGKTR